MTKRIYQALFLALLFLIIIAIAFVLEQLQESPFMGLVWFAILTPISYLFIQKIFPKI